MLAKIKLLLACKILIFIYTCIMFSVVLTTSNRQHIYIYFCPEKYIYLLTTIFRITARKITKQAIQINFNYNKSDSHTEINKIAIYNFSAHKMEIV